MARLRVSDSRESQNFYVEQKGVVCLVVLTKKAQELECHIVKTLTERERDDKKTATPTGENQECVREDKKCGKNKKQKNF